MKRRAAQNDAGEKAGLVSVSFGAALVRGYFLDPTSGRRRRKQIVQRAGGLVHHSKRLVRRRARYARSHVIGIARRSAHPRFRQLPPPDDVTLARKVETEIFRRAQAPKGTINVDAANGVVSLRGTAPTPNEIEKLEHDARAIPGVADVVNLLHLPGTPPPHPGPRRSSNAEPK
jgi:osmotically-inducible protein OsmY